ncbi:type IV secretory system conjugative DNA transfer family protein [Bythopirellula goksoeyrii]|nr:type IV secretory system conjugative DNA transfer family protein [Bythopirellula goksoeyrii]
MAQTSESEHRTSSLNDSQHSTDIPDELDNPDSPAWLEAAEKERQAFLAAVGLVYLAYDSDSRVLHAIRMHCTRLDAENEIADFLSNQDPAKQIDGKEVISLFRVLAKTFLTEVNDAYSDLKSLPSEVGDPSLDIQLDALGASFAFDEIVKSDGTDTSFDPHIADTVNHSMSIDSILLESPLPIRVKDSQVHHGEPDVQGGLRKSPQLSSATATAAIKSHAGKHSDLQDLPMVKINPRDVDIPTRPLRSSANLDGPSARVASWADILPLFVPSELLQHAPSTTHFYGVAPIVETKGSDEFEDPVQHFVAKSFHTLQLPEDLRCRHLLIVGPTGCGKTTKAIIPCLRSDIADPSKTVIVLDSKGGELLPCVYALSDKFRPGKKLHVLDFQQPERSDAWNPLSELTTFSEVRRFAVRLCYAVETRSQPKEAEFWLLASVKFLTGILWALHEDPHELFTLARAQQIAESSIPQMKHWAAAYPNNASLHSSIEFLETGSHNAHTVLTDLQNRLSLWSDENICRVTSSHEIDLGRVLSEPTVLVIRVNEADATPLKPLTNAFFTELVSKLFRMAENAPDGKLPVAVSVLIEEFASAVGRIPDFARFINVVRSRGVSVLASIQTVSQVEMEYGPEANPILAGFCSKLFFPGLELSDAQYASNLFGKMTVEHRERSFMHDRFEQYTSNVNESESIKVIRRDLFAPHEIMRPSEHPELGGAVTFSFPGVPPFQAFLTPAYLFESLGKIVAEAKGRDKLGRIRVDGADTLPIGRSDSSPIGRIDKANNLTPRVTDTREWSEAKLRSTVDQMKEKSLDWCNTTGSARKWWLDFEKGDRQRLAVVFRVAEELRNRQATITEFFLAYVYSNTDNIQANLYYLDYSRLKNVEERSKKEARKKSNSESPPALDGVSVEQNSDDSEGPYNKLDSTPPIRKKSPEKGYFRRHKRNKQDPN